VRKTKDIQSIRHGEKEKRSLGKIVEAWHRTDPSKGRKKVKKKTNEGEVGGEGVTNKGRKVSSSPLGNFGLTGT